MYHLQKRVFDVDIISIKARLTTLESENKTLKEKVKKQDEELKTYKTVDHKRKIEWEEELKEKIKEQIKEEWEEGLREEWEEEWKEEFKEWIVELKEEMKEEWKEELKELNEKIKETRKKLGAVSHDIYKELKRHDNNIFEAIKTFATKETTDEIKNVTIANKRNIIAVASLWLQFAAFKTDIPIYDPVRISKMINKRRKEIREDVYRDMYKRELECKTLDELRKKATKNKISQVDILDAIESPDDKEIKDGYECDMEEESKSKKCKGSSQKTSHDNIRELIINEKIKKLVYPKDQYRYRKVDDLERRFFYDGNKLNYCRNGTISNNSLKNISEKLDKAEIETFSESYNEGFTLEAGFDDY